MSRLILSLFTSAEFRKRLHSYVYFLLYKLNLICLDAIFGSFHMTDYNSVKNNSYGHHLIYLFSSSNFCSLFHSSTIFISLSLLKPIFLLLTKQKNETQANNSTFSSIISTSRKINEWHMLHTYSDKTLGPPFSTSHTLNPPVSYALDVFSPPWCVDLIVTKIVSQETANLHFFLLHTDVISWPLIQSVYAENIALALLRKNHNGRIIFISFFKAPSKKSLFTKTHET